MQLNAEQLKAMEDIFSKREMTLEGFKLMRQDYARVKANVKKLEKKLLILTEQEGPDSYRCKVIVSQVAAIENKYKNIDHAIRHYNIAIKSFNDCIASRHFPSFRPNEK